MNFDTQNFIGFATILGIWFGFWQYLRVGYERKNQIINSLESQLDVTAIWSRVNNEGYLGEPNDNVKLNFSHPFRFIFGIESSVIKNITFQPGIVDFSKEFYKAVAEFNQAVNTLSDLERFLEQLSFNNPEISRMIEMKLNDEEKKLEKSTQSHLSFMNSFNQDEFLAKYISDKIYSFNYQLHYKFIGSEKSGGLNQAHHILIEEINRQKKRNSKENTIQNILLGLSSIIPIIAFLNIWNLNYGNLFSWTLIFSLAMLITIYLLLQNKK